jgi:mannitol/fructose-specific phosphotransferase system IIA component (Ntr-type)
MVGRAAASQMASQALDREVEAIIHTGDDQQRLRFGQLIEGSTVLDLDAAMPCERFFDQAAQALAPLVNVSKDTLFHLLMEREKESSSALRPDLAIPHIIIDGQDTFHMLLARCREGVYFSELAPRVQALFVLAGTRDQRDFHLYALSAIARTVQRSRFQERWRQAKNAAALRHLAGPHR